MNIPKAIEILNLMGTAEFDGHTEDILSARKLGIEALKCIKVLRIIPDKRLNLELPGETKE